jgi:hypothetical protein
LKKDIIEVIVVNKMIMNKGGRPTKYDYPKFEKSLKEYL